jgi:hypothetical protein
MKTKAITIQGRPDFEYGVECGYWECRVCGMPWYPMECERAECPEIAECPVCRAKLDFHPNG